MLSMAGLPSTSAWVSVGPPLSAKVGLRILSNGVFVPLLVALTSDAPGAKPEKAWALVRPSWPNTFCYFLLHSLLTDHQSRMGEKSLVIILYVKISDDLRFGEHT